jgi:hypothetical protein
VEDYEDDEYDETDNSTDEELEAVTRRVMTSVSPPMNINIPSPTNFSRMSIASFPSPSELPPSPPIDAAAAARQRTSSSYPSGQRPISGSQRLSSHRPSSALIGSFIGLDSMAASPDIVQKDRVLVEGVVQALQRCCLQLQRAPENGAGGMREMWRERLVEVMKLLDVAEGHQ